MISKENLDFMDRYVRECTKYSMRKYGRNDKFIIKECDIQIENKSVYGSHISIIMLWCEIGSVVVKVHFNLEVATALASKVLGKPLKDVTKDAAKDFMREFNNMVGGMIRGDLEKNQIPVGMSLPFLAKGKDEIVFRNIRDPRAKVQVWKLTNGENEFVVSSEICLIDTDPIQKAKVALNQEIDAREKSDLNSDGDVSFL